MHPEISEVPQVNLLQLLGQLQLVPLVLAPACVAHSTRDRQPRQGGGKLPVPSSMLTAVATSSYSAYGVNKALSGYDAEASQKPRSSILVVQASLTRIPLRPSNTAKAAWS